MRAAVLGDLVVPLLTRGLVCRQGLRAGCVDSASHELLLEVTLGERRRAVLQVSFLRAACRVPMPASCSVEKPWAQHFAILTPPSLRSAAPANLVLSLSLSLRPPSLCRAWRIIRFHICTQQNHPSLMLHYDEQSLSPVQDQTVAEVNVNMSMNRHIKVNMNIWLMHHFLHQRHLM